MQAEHNAGSDLKRCSLARDVGADGGGPSVYAERAGQLFRIASHLKRIADQYQLAVVTVNQVSDVMTGRDGVAIAPVCHAQSALLSCILSLTICIELIVSLHLRSPSTRAECAW